MNKGIYLDKRTGKWYISTKIQGKTCTIRGYDSKREADNDYSRAIEKWKIAHNCHIGEGNFDNIYIQFVYYRENQVTHETARRDLTQYNTYWKTIFGGQPLILVFERKRLEIVYNNLLKESKYNSKKKYELIRSFKEFACYCYEHRYINIEVYQDVDVIFQKIKIEKNLYKTRRVIPKSHLTALMDAISDESPDFVLFTVFIFLGARISEFLAITFDCYLKEEKKIKIDKQLLTNGEMSYQLKTANSYRKILLSDNVMSLLDEYIKNRNITNGRLFDVSHRTFHRKLEHYEDKAGIPHYTPHEFRHTKATELASKCENIEDVVYCARLLGHTTSMFLNTYCHSMSDEKGLKFL